MTKNKKQLRRLQRNTCSKNLTALLVAALPLGASATLYNDSYTLMTSGQSQYGGSGQSSASYDSGFQGVVYGTYAGNAPAGGSFGSISGSQNAVVVPAIPGTPSISVPSVPGVPAVDVPGIPGTPAFDIPGSGGTPSYTIPGRVIIPGVCFFGKCTSDVRAPDITIPGIPGTPAIHVPAVAGTPAIHIPGTPSVPGYTIPGIPATPAVTADTRTGFSVGVASSGKVGVDVAVQANGGGINVNLPVKTALDITRGANSSFHVGGTSTIGTGASITAIAPSFNANVNGVINLDNKISGTGCFLGAGCSTSSSNANINPGKFGIVALDTAKAQPLSVLGVTIPITASGQSYTIREGQPPCPTKDCANSPFATNALAVVQETTPKNVTGGMVSGSNLALTTNNPLLRTTADLPGIAQAALAVPVDVLNPKLSFAKGLVSASGKTFDAQVGVTVGVSQAFSLNTQHMLATLQFDKPVSVLIPGTPAIPGVPGFGGIPGSCFGVFGQKICTPSIPGFPGIPGVPAGPSTMLSLGNKITVDLATGGDFYGTGNLISRSYTLSGADDFTSNTRLSIDPTVPLMAACYDLTVPGLGSNACAYNDEFKTTNLLDASLYTNTFNLGGFNSATFLSPVQIDPDPARTPPGSDVPEPATLWLGAAALLALVAARRSPKKCAHKTTVSMMAAA